MSDATTWTLTRPDVRRIEIRWPGDNGRYYREQKEWPAHLIPRMPKKRARDTQWTRSVDCLNVVEGNGPFTLPRGVALPVLNAFFMARNMERPYEQVAKNYWYFATRMAALSQYADIRVANAMQNPEDKSRYGYPRLQFSEFNRGVDSLRDIYDFYVGDWHDTEHQGDLFWTYLYRMVKTEIQRFGPMGMCFLFANDIMPTETHYSDLGRYLNLTAEATAKLDDRIPLRMQSDSQYLKCLHVSDLVNVLRQQWQFYALVYDKFGSKQDRDRTFIHWAQLIGDHYVVRIPEAELFPFVQVGLMFRNLTGKIRPDDVYNFIKAESSGGLGPDDQQLDDTMTILEKVQTHPNLITDLTPPGSVLRTMECIRPTGHVTNIRNSHIDGLVHENWRLL